MKWFTLSTTVLSSITVVSSICTLTCEVGKTCYTTAQPALDCLYSIPFNEVIILPYSSLLDDLIVGMGQYNSGCCHRIP